MHPPRIAFPSYHWVYSIIPPTSDLDAAANSSPFAGPVCNLVSNPGQVNSTQYSQLVRNCNKKVSMLWKIMFISAPVMQYCNDSSAASHNMCLLGTVCIDTSCFAPAFTLPQPITRILNVSTFLRKNKGIGQ